MEDRISSVTELGLVGLELIWCYKHNRVFFLPSLIAFTVVFELCQSSLERSWDLISKDVRVL